MINSGSFQEFITKISQPDIPLKGTVAHSELFRRPVPTQELTSNAMKASVLCLFFPSEEENIHFALIKRVSHVKDDPHAGQISFPGGSKEGEETNEYTAKRETYEEIGVSIESIHIIKEISPLYIPISNFYVTPFIGYIDYEPTFNLQLSEVHSVIFPTLEQLLDPQNMEIGTLNSRGVSLKNVKYFNFDGEIVWGATAMMLNEIKHYISQAINE